MLALRDVSFEAGQVIGDLSATAREAHFSYIASFRGTRDIVRSLRRSALNGEDITDDLAELDETLGDLLANLEEQAVR